MNMTALERIEPQETAIAPANESAAILQVIERAAMNPNVDIDKMERLLQMQERVLERDAKAQYAAAFADMQAELPEVEKKGKGHGSIKYAKWENIIGEIRPVLQKYGFGLSFRVSDADNGVYVTAILMHRAGHSEETSRTFPADKSGSKNDIQSVGSAIQYGKRYMGCAILNITTGDEQDDDGRAAGAGEPITDAQREQLAELIDRTETDIAKFCAHFKVDALADLPMTKFGGALAALQKKDAANV